METELCNMCMITDSEGRVLVQERLPKPSNPWSGLTFPGGHVEPGETVVASVIREVQEETGLNVSNLQNCGYIQWYNPIKQSQYFVFLFKTSTFSGELTGSVEGNVKWMTLVEMLAGKLASNMTKYLAVFQNETIPQAYGISGKGLYLIDNNGERYTNMNASSSPIGNENKKIGQISLTDLCNGKYEFIIPTYQRGYRWRTKHVEALINDLASIPKNKTYCLQPIVLQKNKNGNGFLVVDGQQRLTTLLLLLNAWKDEDEDKDEYVWEMAPENEHEKQGVLNEACRQNTTNIAKNTEDKKKNEIKGKLDKIFFIWYLLDDTEDGHAAFQRLNSGKIPLTSSELIRAKLVGPGCTNRYELAAEWERIEQRLRDDRFWFMFNGKASESFTRIDKLFEIITNTEEKVKLDRLAPYYAVEKNDKESWWEKLLNLFWMLEQCYNDVERYHYIGWLRHFRNWQFSSIYDIYRKDKINFTQMLQQEIIKALRLQKDDGSPNIDEFNYDTDKSILRSFFVLLNIESLNTKVRCKDEKSRKRNEYERFPFDLYANLSWDIEHIDSHTNNPMDDPAEQVEWAIETYLESKDKTCVAKILNWLKHCNEQKYIEEKKKVVAKISGYNNDESKNKDKDLLTWLEKQQKKDYLEFFNSETNNESTLDFKDVYKDYINEYCKNCINDDDKNQIGNLTLLDYHTNRSYHNAIFPRKRRTIIETDQTCTDDTFIPPCTRNVFTKYYTQMAVSITQWTLQDADSYRNAIVETFARLIKAAGYKIKKDNEK